MGFIKNTATYMGKGAIYLIAAFTVGAVVAAGTKLGSRVGDDIVDRVYPVDDEPAIKISSEDIN